jgi:hypothetical protein
VFFDSCIFSYDQVERPPAMKKDSIQTRNRKLATKATKRKSIMHDFFKPFDSRFSAMYSSMGSSYLAAAAVGNPMSQYYGQMGAVSSMQPFMCSSNTAASHLGPTSSSLMPSTASTSSLGLASTSSSPSPSIMGHTSAESLAAAAAGFSPYVMGSTANNNAASSAASSVAMPIVGASA